MCIAWTINRLLRRGGIQIVRSETLARLEFLQPPLPDSELAAAGLSQNRSPALPEPQASPGFETAVRSGWADDPLALLRKKWAEIPAGDRRQSSAQLLRQSDAEILAEWERATRNDTEGVGFGVRGWYHDMYRSIAAGKEILDVGCGMAPSTLSFAEMGAHLTFTDIVPENVELVRRLCRIKGIPADFHVIERLEDIDALGSFDVVTAIGSLINAPLAVTRSEVARLKMHLRPGGRWLHLAYPKRRWEREGGVPFAEWGAMTDGPGTPWMEYHDRSKILWLFEPSEIRILFECEWHDNDFNWFDIELISR